MRRRRLPLIVLTVVMGGLPLHRDELRAMASQTQPADPTSSTPAPLLTDCSATRPRTDVEQMALPQSTGDLLKLLAMCRATAQMLIDSGQTGLVFLPAMEGKDVALALEQQAGSVRNRQQVVSAVHRLVIAAWRLDADGDLGNRDRLTDSYKLFAAAVGEITSAYAGQ